MLMDPMGGIVMTNDGNAILREVSSSSSSFNLSNGHSDKVTQCIKAA